MRDYFERQPAWAVDRIRSMQIELEPLSAHEECRRIRVHLLSDDDRVDTLVLDITREEEPRLFDERYEDSFYFLQRLDETTLVRSAEESIQHVYSRYYSLAKTSADAVLLEHPWDANSSLQRLLDAYVNDTLSVYSRHECMRLAVEYSFHHLLDQLDSHKFQSAKERELHVRTTMMKEIQTILQGNSKRRVV